MSVADARGGGRGLQNWKNDGYVGRIDGCLYQTKLGYIRDRNEEMREREREINM